MITNIWTILATGSPAQIAQIAPLIAVAVALFAILPPLLTLAYSIWSNARTRRRENERFEWERLNELAKAIYNKDHEYGLWRQRLAISELGSFARKREPAIQLLAMADAHYRGKAANRTSIDHREMSYAQDLLPAFDEASKRLGPARKRRSKALPDATQMQHAEN